MCDEQAIIKPSSPLLTDSAVAVAGVGRQHHSSSADSLRWQDSGSHRRSSLKQLLRVASAAGRAAGKTEWPSAASHLAAGSIRLWRDGRQPSPRI